MVHLGEIFVHLKILLVLKWKFFNHELTVDAEVRFGFEDGRVLSIKFHRIGAG